MTVGMVRSNEEQHLFSALCATKRQANETGSSTDLRKAVEAYQRFMRFHLTDPEREVLRLEDIVAALTLENRLLKARLEMAERRAA